VDPATLIGVTLGFIALFVMQIMEGGSPGSIFLIPPLILIFFGSAGASLASNTVPGTISAMKWLSYAVTAKKADLESVVEPLVKMAERARREGLLALEQEMEKVDDPFMRKGLQMAVDGTDPDDLYDILTAEVRARKASAKVGATFWNDAGGYAPTIGIIGTVVGLVHVLENLSEPDKLGT
jgi:chemotaxis protein MotA